MEGKLPCILVFVFVSYFSFCVSGNNVPVLLWESKGTGEQFRPVPALAEYGRDEFLNHFLKKIKTLNSKPLIVVFLEDTLSLEDFTWQDSSQRQAFSNVKKYVDHAKGIEFLPAVKSAADALQKLEGYGYKSKDLKNLHTNEEGILSVVQLEDAESGEDRSDLLNRHDVQIAEVLKDLTGSQSNFITVLTGKEASWIEPEISLPRARRALQASVANATVSNSFLFNATGNILLLTAGAPILTVDGESVVLPTNHTDKFDTRPTGKEARIISTFVGDKKIVLRFKFETSSDTWALTEVNYTFDTKEGTLFPTKPISAARDSPFFASSSTEFYSENKTSSLVFRNLKTQPWTKGQFSPMESTIGFFTIPIWMGILVVSMLSLIMVWGLTMLLDIKTMDQFDDPKGKTISINASE